MIATLVAFATASTQRHPPPPPPLLHTSPIKRSKDFPAGWNNLSRTPQLGWRSWNAFGNRITQEMMLAAADALVAKNRTVKGIYGNVSLCGIGYCDIGVDEGWEGCGAGVNGTQHDSDGTPTIDSDFPDTKKMVDEIHAKGLKAGWYLNGCKCGERSEHTINYEGDVRSLAAFGFDDVKIDGCGAQRNMTLYAELMRETGKAFTIENCHWGRCTDSDDSSCPTLDWCPFNSYRTSGDINAGSESWFQNLQTTIQFQDYEAPLSRPGCWAYPDMLEVGRVAEPAPGAFFVWNRAHFGAWCITSSPLILGMELTDAKLEPVLDIIGNLEAIAVNQAWDGHPGLLVETLHMPPVPFDPSGVELPSSSAGDFGLSGGATLTNSHSDNATSGLAIRSGNPGTISRISIGSGLIGNGHKLDSISMQFRYEAGYTPEAGQTKQPATVRLLLTDVATEAEVRELWKSGPLGNYSYDQFTGYSPPIVVSATGLAQPNEAALMLTLEVTDHERNLQLPIDNLVAGWNVKVSWEGAPATAPVRAAVEAVTGEPIGRIPKVTVGVAPVAGQLWSKRLPHGGSAALLINHSPMPLQYMLNLTKLNLTMGVTYKVRDVWERVDILPSVTTQLALSVPAWDSAFVTLMPE